MTFTPNPPFGTGGAVTSTTSTTNADSGAKNFPASPNSNGVHATQTFIANKLNILNVGTTPPAAKN